VPTPSPESFAALARSSPWLWSTLRFTGRGLPDARPTPVRAWLRRPDLLRVETLGGTLLQVVREAGPVSAVLTVDGGSPAAPPSQAVTPVFRGDGLVEVRPGDRWSYDAPMYQNYRWVAMLDPLELADGIDRASDATVPALDVSTVTEVEHGGRPAWEAVVTTTPAYEPRCGCCPLLRSREVDLLEYADQPDHILAVYPEAYRVRLDVGTGICVGTQEIGGLTPGAGHDLRIEAVDEPMAADLFRPPARSRRGRPGRGWQPIPDQ
jgi:hypothetical protein